MRDWDKKENQPIIAMTKSRLQLMIYIAMSIGFGAGFLFMYHSQLGC